MQIDFKIACKIGSEDRLENSPGKIAAKIAWEDRLGGWPGKIAWEDRREVSLGGLPGEIACLYRLRRSPRENRLEGNREWQ